MAMARRLMVSDDDELVREAYRSFFANRRDFEIVAEAADGVRAVEAYAATQPDVVLMDLQMPRMNGVQATAEISRQWPDACIVMLTTFGSREHIVPALRAGAAGYLLKDSGPEALVNGINQALAGEMPLAASVRRELVRSLTDDDTGRTDPAVQLSPRELELLGWLAHGLGNAEIANKMFLSESSVKQQLAGIGQKLGASSRTQILVRAIQLGLTDPRRLPPLE
ncbi:MULTISPECIES: response regulator transcription factor [unclassified Luteococcus]|uniref:response regulator transcription factor n=1 Tax=unclassified Luteococcus TaxID=2639923 RepID=UPI00313C14DF